MQFAMINLVMQVRNINKLHQNIGSQGRDDSIINSYVYRLS